MTWKPAADTDEKIREWMTGRRWPVTSTDYDAERQVYSWTHHHRHGRRSVTLQITKSVLEGYPWFAIWEHFDRLNVGAALRGNPEAHFVLVQRGQAVVLEEW